MIKQFLKYSVVGLASNLILYLAYLVITNWGGGHKTTMTVLYATGVCLTFAFNRNWTFHHKGRVSRSFVLYLLIYLLGYFINLFALFLFVDTYGYRHQLVQGIMILFLAIFLFVLQKQVVFADSV